jgi:hypothetical protein
MRSMEARRWDYQKTSNEMKKIAGRGNPTYIQQFIVRGKPENLPEWAREALAKLFGLEDANILRPNFKPKTPQAEITGLIDTLPEERQSAVVELVRQMVRLLSEPPAPAGTRRRRVGG